MACKVCIVGAGPAGFYAAQKISRLLPEAAVDILEKLPVPFGLVRFGVAPDHPEVKNVINTFNKVANSKNVSFFGNIRLGRDVTLAQLKQNYHAVLLSYGAEEDKTFDIKNENLANVISAKDFVGWYNGSPYHQKLKVDLSTSSAAVLGQGNVAMDVARILLTPIDELKKTDITENALSTLSCSRIKNVYLIGRRGPLQAAFTIKELRELLNLPTCQTIWRKKDLEGLENFLPDLARPRKRITELMLKNLQQELNAKFTQRFLPVFFRSPLKFLAADSGRLIGLELGINKLIGDDILNQRAVETEQREILNCGLALRSIGYRSLRADPDIHFNVLKGHVENINGRVLSKPGVDGVQLNGKRYEPGLYVTGWLQTGPTGVILTTMSNAFEVGALLCTDINDKNNFLETNSTKAGFEGVREILNRKNIQIVTWKDWERIDKAETDAGLQKGKPREKICSVEAMLNICK